MQSYSLIEKPMHVYNFTNLSLSIYFRINYVGWSLISSKISSKTSSKTYSKGTFSFLRITRISCITLKESVAKVKYK